MSANTQLMTQSAQLLIKLVEIVSGRAPPKTDPVEACRRAMEVADKLMENISALQAPKPGSGRKGDIYCVSHSDGQLIYVRGATAAHKAFGYRGSLASFRVALARALSRYGIYTRLVETEEGTKAIEVKRIPAEEMDKAWEAPTLDDVFCIEPKHVRAPHLVRDIPPDVKAVRREQHEKNASLQRAQAACKADRTLAVEVSEEGYAKARSKTPDELRADRYQAAHRKR